MTQHYTLADFQAQEHAVLSLQRRVRGNVIEIPRRIGPQQDTSFAARNATDPVTIGEIKEISGGPERTRISDLYRVKVELALTYGYQH